MSFADIQEPIAPAPAGSGVKASMRPIRGIASANLQLSITSEAWERMFGQPFKPGDRVHVMAGTGEDAGKVQIKRSSNGNREAKPSIRGSVRVLVGRWEGLPREKVKAEACDLVRTANGLVVLKLPMWAQPAHRRSVA